MSAEHRPEPGGDDWVDRDVAVVWHGFTQMAAYPTNSPVTVERAEGRELIDVDGNRYFDAISSLWVTTLGHRVPELDAAIVDQLGKVAHATLLGNGSRAVIEFAEALAEVVPVDDAHTIFASDGAVAVEQALKIAFQCWVNRGRPERNRFLALGDAYHGDTVGALSLGDGGFGTTVFDPLRFPVERTPGYASADWATKAVAAVVAHADTLAAMVIEPLVQGASGILVADPEDLALVGRACRGARGPADLRRGRHGVRSDGSPVRLRVGRPRVPARHRLPRQGHHGWLPPAVRHRGDRAGLRVVLG